MKLFYSWQSDLPNKQNRFKILKAIDSAIRTIDTKYELVLDEATRNESGSVDIVSTILKKIDESNIFVADVTPIFQYMKEDAIKIAPNPNVMFELGYATHRLGKERIILLCNKDYSKDISLPFDIRNNRILYFTSDTKKLETDLFIAIDIILKNNPELPDRIDAMQFKDKEIASTFVDDDYYKQLEYKSDQLLTSRGCTEEYYHLLDDRLDYLDSPQNRHYDHRLEEKQNKFKESLSKYRMELATQLFVPVTKMEAAFDFSFGMDLKSQNPSLYYSRVEAVKEKTSQMLFDFRAYRECIRDVLLV